MELKNDLAQKLTLRAILLRNSQISIAPDFDPLIPNQLLEGQFRRLPELTITGREMHTQPDDKVFKICGFVFPFEFRFVQPGEAGKIDLSDDEIIVASIKAEILVDYLFDGESFPSQEELITWAQSAALVQAWPYWREFCHNTLIRAGLPMALMPMLIMNQKADSSEEESKS
jgi:hypothetical protein